jgi:hypothetical protein
MYKRVRRITSGQAVKPTESRGVGSEARDTTSTICHNRISNHRSFFTFSLIISSTGNANDSAKSRQKFIIEV